MNKLLMFLLGLMLLSTPQAIFRDKFIASVDEAYSEYTIIADYTSELYSIQIAKGLINEKATYGISFFSSRAGDYYLYFEIDSIEYKISPDSRGDYQLLGIKWRDYEQVKIKIYSKDGNLQYPTHPTVLEKFDKSSFTGNHMGLDEGGTLTSLKKVDGIINFNVYFIVALIIIAICVIVITILALTKRGMFSKEVRKEGVFDFKEFIDKQITSQDNDDWIEVKPESDMEKPANQENPREVYEKGHRYDDDEISSINVSKHLQDAGFVVDYSLAGDEEKNMIMLELMHLKNERKISNDVYLEEIYKLWKK